jgi:hypothetical protein
LAVGEVVAADRVHAHQIEVVCHFAVQVAEKRLDGPRHGQHVRAGVEVKAPAPGTSGSQTFSLPPTARLSTTVTSWPAWASRSAHTMPPTPAPITTTRIFEYIGGAHAPPQLTQCRIFRYHFDGFKNV